MVQILKQKKQKKKTMLPGNKWDSSTDEQQVKAP